MHQISTVLMGGSHSKRDLKPPPSPNQNWPSIKKSAQDSSCLPNPNQEESSIKDCSVEDETQNAELNGNRNPEWCVDLSQSVKIEIIKFLGISRHKVELGFRLDLSSEVSCGTNSN